MQRIRIDCITHQILEPDVQKITPRLRLGKMESLRHYGKGLAHLILAPSANKVRLLMFERSLTYISDGFLPPEVATAIDTENQALATPYGTFPARIVSARLSLTEAISGQNAIREAKFRSIPTTKLYGNFSRNSRNCAPNEKRPKTTGMTVLGAAQITSLQSPNPPITDCEWDPRNAKKVPGR